MARYAVLQKGAVVGVADMEESYLAGEEVSLQATDADEMDLTTECSETNERPCELTAILGMAQYLAEQAGVSSAEVDALEAKGATTEDEAKAAVCAVVARLPEDMQPQGNEVLIYGWGECGCDCPEPGSGRQ